MSATIEKILPIILFFLLGYISNKKQLIARDSMADIKKLVINFAMPSVLFKTFLTMEFQMEYLTILLLTPVVLALFMLFGRLANFVPFFHNRFNPFVTTGYSFGLVGVSMFSIMYGAENIALFSIIGLAHEVFVWTFYFMVLKISLFNIKVGIKEIVKLLCSPIMFSIMLGVFLNLFSVNVLLEDSGLWNGFMSTLDYMSDTSTPLILLSIGYNINLSGSKLRSAGKLIFLKMMAVVMIGIPFKVFVIDNLIEPSYWLTVSYYSFILLPPIFAFPIFVSEIATDEEIETLSSATAIYTLVSITLFVAFAIFSS